MAVILQIFSHEWKCFFVNLYAFLCAICSFQPGHAVRQPASDPARAGDNHSGRGWVR